MDRRLRSRIAESEMPVDNWRACCMDKLSFQIFQMEGSPDLHSMQDLLADTYCYLRVVDLLHARTIDFLLKSLATTQNDYVRVQDFKFIPRNRWFCRLLILACLEAGDDKLLKECSFLLREALATFKPARNESAHLLLVIHKFSIFLNVEDDPSIAADLIDFVRTANLSSTNTYKKYLELIATRAIGWLKKEQYAELTDVNNLPIRGISIGSLDIKVDIGTVELAVARIIEMFSNNIEHREGGMLYKKLINNLSYDDFEKLVMPQFSKKFQDMDFEGEFFQCLQKYWIPLMIHRYPTSFVALQSDIDWVPKYLKGCMLCELRKKCIAQDFQFVQYQKILLKLLFSREETRKIAFKIPGCCKYAYISCFTQLDQNGMWYFLEGQSFPLNPEENLSLYKYFKSTCCSLVRNKMRPRALRNFLAGTCSYAMKLLITDRKFLGAQILNHLFKDGPKSLINTLLAFEEEFCPNFFIFLKLLNSKEFADRIEELVAENEGACQELCQLAGHVIKSPKIITNNFLIKFIDKSCSTLSINAIDQVRNLTNVIIQYNVEHSPGPDDIYELHFDLQKDLLTGSDFTTQNGIFKAALLLEALKHLAQNLLSVRLENLNEFLSRVVELMLTKDLIEVDHNSNTRIKSNKILDSLYNNLCQYLENIPLLPGFDFEFVTKKLIDVIENSGKRRPTMTSVAVLRKFFRISEKLDNGLASFWHSQILTKIDCVGEIQNLQIRKNAEMRLILHALCQTNGSRDLLRTTLDHILKILSNDQTTNATKAAVFNCTELLMSDNTMYDDTIEYAPKVILECVRHFEIRNWVVRNACVQLQKSLIDRFLGVHMGHNRRNRAIDDLFILFPEIILPFYQVLVSTTLNDSALAVMQFFSESQLKMRPFTNEIQGLEPFLQAFIVLIKTNSDIYGVFAARAYVSLCLEKDIPNIIQHIAGYIIEEFLFIKQHHTIRNFMLVLQELNDKYLNFISVKPTKPKGFYQISNSLDNLADFLFQKNYLNQMDLLLVNLYSFEMLLSSFNSLNFQMNLYTDRIWLNNNVPFFINHAPLNTICDTLSLVLSKNLTECLQVKVLATLVDRFDKRYNADFPLHQVLNVLISYALGINNASNFLLMSYLKVIFMFFECCQCFDKYRVVRVDNLGIYDETGNNIYKILIKFLKLYELHITDAKFVNLSIKYLQKNLAALDEDILQMFSKMLKYIYECSACYHDKEIILKLALYLIRKHGLCHFASFVRKLRIPTPIQAMEVLLEKKFLTNYFGSLEKAVNFVKEFYKAVIEESNVAKGSHESFYDSEECFFVSKDKISDIVLNFVKYDELDIDPDLELP